jgi:hypothetical protein
MIRDKFLIIDDALIKFYTACNGLLRTFNQEPGLLNVKDQYVIKVYAFFAEQSDNK